MHEKEWNRGVGGMTAATYSKRSVLLLFTILYYRREGVCVSFCLYVSLLMCWCIWCLGVSACCCVGVLLCWFFGVLVCWYVRVLVCWCICVCLCVSEY